VKRAESAQIVSVVIAEMRSKGRKCNPLRNYGKGDDGGLGPGRRLRSRKLALFQLVANVV